MTGGATNLVPPLHIPNDEYKGDLQVHPLEFITKTYRNIIEYPSLLGFDERCQDGFENSMETPSL